MPSGFFPGEKRSVTSRVFRSKYASISLLTVALFVAGKAYEDPVFQDPAKMGAVLSAGAGVIAFIVGRLLKVNDGPDE